MDVIGRRFGAGVRWFIVLSMVVLVGSHGVWRGIKRSHGVNEGTGSISSSDFPEKVGNRARPLWESGSGGVIPGHMGREGKKEDGCGLVVKKIKFYPPIFDSHLRTPRAHSSQRCPLPAVDIIRGFLRVFYFNTLLELKPAP